MLFTDRLGHVQQVLKALIYEEFVLERRLRNPHCSHGRQLRRLQRLERLKPQLRRWQDEWQRIEGKNGTSVKAAVAEESIFPAGYAL